LCCGRMEGAALDTFVERAKKAANNDDLVRIIRSALDHHQVFVFGELLALPSVAALENVDKNTLALLKIFAYGTLADYREQKLPPLSDAQLQKLRKLTVISLTSEKKLISYEELLRQLDLSSQRELEDILIECLYQGLLKGKLDHKRQALEVEYSTGRDLRPGQLDEVQEILTQWLAQSEALLKTINEKTQEAHLHQDQTKIRKQELDTKIETMKATLRLQMEHEMMIGDSMANMGGLATMAGMGRDYDDDRRKGGRKGGKKGGKGGGPGYMGA